MFCKLIFVISLLVTAVLSDSGLCRYDPYKCSCKIGAANQGICWDKVEGNPTMCNRRFCRAGWTCACAGRTHVCTRSDKVVNTLVNPADKNLPTASCSPSPQPLVSSIKMSLGTLKIHLSTKGIAKDNCNQIAWWHNGVLLGNHKLNKKVVTGEELVVAQKQRQEHDKLELLPGDLLAFRIKDGSYYCYKHLTEFVINGTSANSEMLGFNTYYARKHSVGWYMPTYVLDDTNTAEDESEEDRTKFLPLRLARLDSNETIISNVDYWEEVDQSKKDTKKSNWYYRIEIPEFLPTSQ